jgi:hypothetical protein
MRQGASSHQPVSCRRRGIDDFSADAAYCVQEINRLRAENTIPWWNLSRHGSVRSVIRSGLEQMWAQGPGGTHFENLRGQYTEVGCGIFVSDGEVTVSQDFR